MFTAIIHYAAGQHHYTGTITRTHLVDIVIRDVPDEQGSWGLTTMRTDARPNNGGYYYEHIYVRPTKVEIKDERLPIDWNLLATLEHDLQVQAETIQSISQVLSKLTAKPL